MYHHMSSWFWLFGPLIMLVWIAILGIVVYLAVRLVAPGADRAPDLDRLAPPRDVGFR